VFGSARVIAHLPTIWAILLTGDASQHSVWTWLTWVGANGTMAAALHEQNGQRIDRAIVVNLGNTAMCLATTALIVYSRYLVSTVTQICAIVGICAQCPPNDAVGLFDVGLARIAIQTH